MLQPRLLPAACTTGTERPDLALGPCQNGQKRGGSPYSQGLQVADSALTHFSERVSCLRRAWSQAKEQQLRPGPGRRGLVRPYYILWGRMWRSFD